MCFNNASLVKRAKGNLIASKQAADRAIFTINFSHPFFLSSIKIWYNPTNNAISTATSFPGAAYKECYYGTTILNIWDLLSKADNFNDGELYTQFNIQNITIYKVEERQKETLNKKNNENYKFKGKKEFGLYFNENTMIDKVSDLSGDDELIGKCMKYHGGNKFVLYNPKKEKVYMEYPKVEKKTSLEKDDIVYDMIYVDNKFKTPCIHINELQDRNGKIIKDCNV